MADTKIKPEEKSVIDLLGIKEVPKDLKELEDLIKKATDKVVEKAKKDTEEEKNNIRKEAAKTEKDKLYSKIEGLEKSLKFLEDASKQKDNVALEAERLKKEAEDKLVKDKLPLEDRIKDLEQKLKESTEITESVAKKAESMLQLTLDSAKKEIHLRDMQVYAKDMIAQANGEIIPELVRGETKEEVDASVQAAKTRYQELIAKKTEKDAQRKLEEGKVSTTAGEQVITDTNIMTKDLWKMTDDEIKAFSKQTVDSLLAKHRTI